MPERFQVKFSEQFSTSDFKVLEVNEAILNEILNSETPFAFKGEVGEQAVLCSDKATHAVRSLESSNTIFLAPQQQQPQQQQSAGERTLVIEGAITHTLELVPEPPRLQKLKRLLSECYYTPNTPTAATTTTSSSSSSSSSSSGSEGGVEPLQVTSTFWSDSMPSSHSPAGPPLPVAATPPLKRPNKAVVFYTKEQLRERVQCSDRELDAALDALHAVVTSTPARHVMLIAPDTLSACLDSLLTIADGSGWDFSALSQSRCLQELQEYYDPAVVLQALQCFASPQKQLDRSSSTKDGDDVLWALNEESICVYRAEQMLSSHSTWKVEDFLTRWRESVPSQFTPQLRMLQRHVLQETKAGVPHLEYFPWKALSTVPKERFRALFDKRKKWVKAELVPFVSDLVVPPQTADSLLAKHAREHSEKGVRYCCGIG